MNFTYSTNLTRVLKKSFHRGIMLTIGKTFHIKWILLHSTFDDELWMLWFLLEWQFDSAITTTILFFLWFQSEVKNKNIICNNNVGFANDEMSFLWYLFRETMSSWVDKLKFLVIWQFYVFIFQVVFGMLDSLPGYFS